MSTPTSLLQQAIHERVELVPYNSNWPEQFEQERVRLTSLFPNAFLRIEHVGSTAIPGLTAKAIIDILAAVPSLDDADALLPLLCQWGYDTSPDYNRKLGTSRWLMRHENGRRTHHVHLVLPESAEWVEKLRFRDALRLDPHLAAEYAALKAQLASRLGDDREAYGDAKGEFVQRVLSLTA